MSSVPSPTADVVLCADHPSGARLQILATPTGEIRTLVETHGKRSGAQAVAELRHALARRLGGATYLESADTAGTRADLLAALLADDLADAGTDDDGAES